MKNLTATLLFLFLFSIVGYSQDSAIRFVSAPKGTPYSTLYFDDFDYSTTTSVFTVEDNSLTYRYKDSTWDIQGDTVLLLKMLFKSMIENQHQNNYRDRQVGVDSIYSNQAWTLEGSTLPKQNFGAIDKNSVKLIKNKHPYRKPKTKHKQK